MSTYDWSQATVRVRVPVVHTTSTEVVEVDIPLATFWALVESHGQHLAAGFHEVEPS